jgi:hypothetical protein
MKVSEKTLIKKIRYLENKYYELVWLSRTGSQTIDKDPSVKKKVEQIIKKYPRDIQLLEEFGDWTHGFNSGSLSGMRYVLDLILEGEEISEQNYPNMDS